SLMYAPVWFGVVFLFSFLPAVVGGCIAGNWLNKTWVGVAAGLFLSWIGVIIVAVANSKAKREYEHKDMMESREKEQKVMARERESERRHQEIHEHAAALMREVDEDRIARVKKYEQENREKIAAAQREQENKEEIEGAKREQEQKERKEAMERLEIARREKEHKDMLAAVSGGREVVKVRCSKCGALTLMNEGVKFCSECGALM
ncbi:MAG: hypothetical protein NTW26_00320, partial [bacterium]|nr:hypothetical protein [bacterium]